MFSVVCCVSDGLLSDESNLSIHITVLDFPQWALRGPEQFEILEPLPRLPCCHVLSVVSSNYCRLSARPGARWRQLYPSHGTWLSTVQVIRPFPWPLDHTPTYSKPTGQAVFTKDSCSLTSSDVMAVLFTRWFSFFVFAETQADIDTHVPHLQMHIRAQI